MDKQFDLEAFKAFVASKSADEEYEYTDPCGCAIYMFLHETGRGVFSVNPSDWRDAEFRRHPIPEALDEASRAEPWTFGALADRLEPTLAAQESAR